MMYSSSVVILLFLSLCKEMSNKKTVFGEAFCCYIDYITFLVVQLC